ncbi:MAG: hypothetical protein JO043_00050, partial [Candidatus Eremiobacteraeota bacterium]|nr:hypothetical protein [Candidatus Eremiobacteraeota bacterium]
MRKALSCDAEAWEAWEDLTPPITADYDPVNVVARLRLTEAYLAESNARAQETYDAATRAR